MTDLSLPPTTLSSLSTGENSYLSNAPGKKSPSHRPELLGKQFGWVVVTSAQVVWRGKLDKHGHQSRFRYLHTRCVKCGTEKLINYDNLVRGKTKGCQSCSQTIHPMHNWLSKRLHAAHNRCVNPRYRQYSNYGGRGITFDFPSVPEAIRWVLDNLALPEEPDRKIEIDRIDNDKGYAPGNLRFAPRSTNQINRRITRSSEVKGIRAPNVEAIHLFRKMYPEVKYADATLKRLMYHFTDAEIADRFFNLPSCKPKGVYGTFSTPDPSIVSRYLES